MENSYYILTLDKEPFQVQFLGGNDFAEKIEQTTGILSVCQEYYKSGRKIQLDDLKTDDNNLVSVIDKQIPANRYFISTPSGQIRVCITDPEQKTIKNLVFSFHVECKNKVLSYLTNEYSFSYKDEFLPYDCPLSQIPHDSIIDLINQPAYPQVAQITLIVATLTGKRINISLFENNLIKDLKNEIQKMEGIPIDKQKLMFAGMLVNSEKTLYDYNIQDNSRLYLVLSSRAPKVFTFNEMRIEIKLESSSNVPEWRIVEPGISFIGICANNECAAYNHEVISNAKLGVFDINRQAGMMPCPICKQLLNNTKKCGFYMAEWRFFGIDSKGFERLGNGDAYENNYVTFLNGEDEEWRVLRIAVRQSDKYS